MAGYSLSWTEENYGCTDLEPILLNYSIKSKKRWGYGIDEGLIFSKEFHAEFYLTGQEMKKEADNWYRFLTDKKRFASLLRSIRQSSRLVEDQTKKLATTDLSKLSKDKLLKMYDSYGASLGSLLNCYIVSEPHRITKLEKELAAYLKKKKVKDISNHLSILASPNKKISFSTEGNRLFKGSFSEILKQENSVIDKSLIKKEMYKEILSDNKEKKRVLSELKPNKKIMQIIEVLSILGHERLKMRLVWMPALYYNELFLIEFKRRYDIGKAELRLYEYPEIKHLILFNQKLDKNIIELRKRGFLKHLKGNEIITYEGDISQDMLNKLVKEDENKKELKGTVASKGYAKGKVVILSYKRSEDHAEKIKRMQPGDIIVTEMTRPNIITACEKAGAIITDEGGILCHAAIISREMKKPCIIGTKVATKVLKDGDIVEVDAEKGIIKKIKQN